MADVGSSNSKNNPLALLLGVARLAGMGINWMGTRSGGGATRVLFDVWESYSASFLMLLNAGMDSDESWASYLLRQK